MFPGVYSIRISKQGYRTIEQTITVEENPSQDPVINTFNFPLDDLSGQLSITVTPADAQVILNKQAYSANAPLHLPAGQYLLEVQSNNYRSYTETITITEKETLSRTINLEPITGSLFFRIQPITASVRLYNSAGQLIDEWTGAKQFPNLPIGQYRIDATAPPNYQAYTETFTITENNSRFGYNLEQVQPQEESASRPTQAAITTSDAERSMQTITSADMPASSFTRGSHEDDVIRVQGTPTEINRYPALGFETWYFGRSTVRIGSQTRRVLEWNNRGNLKVQLLSGDQVTAATTFSRGSHEDDVIRVQGTPTEINRYPALGFETWYFGRSTVRIGSQTRRVLEWDNQGNLKVGQ